MPSIDYALIRRQHPIPAYLRRVGIKLESGMWKCLCPNHNEKTGSCHVVPGSGDEKWKCFGCGETGDVIDLEMHRTGCDHNQAVINLHGQPVEPTRPRPAPGSRPRIVLDYGPIPEEHATLKAGIDTGAFLTRDGRPKSYKPLLVHEYRDPTGRLLAYAVRVPKGRDGKIVLPCRFDLTLKQLAWAGFSGSESSPLYNWPELARRPDAPVLVVEGEKAVDLLQPLLPDWVVTCWFGGSSQDSKADLSPLDNRHVTYWRDADATGDKAMTRIAERTNAATRRWVTIEKAWEEHETISGYDAADLLAEAGIAAVRERLVAATVYRTQAEMRVAETDNRWLKIKDGGWCPDDAVLIRNDNGNIKSSDESNAMLVLMHHPRFSSLHLDLFTQAPLFEGMVVGKAEAHWILRVLHEVSGLSPGGKIGPLLIYDAAEAKPINNLAVRLRAIQWDGKERPLWRYLGIRDWSLWKESAVRRWFLGVVHRVLHPGAQQDLVLIMEGEQGWGKTSALRVLASPLGIDGYVELDRLTSDRDTLMKLRGKVICELNELTALKKDSEGFKALLSATTDNYRLPYARMNSDVPRSASFAGTTNQWGGYLKDPTGNRRFCPVGLDGFLSLSDLRRDVDQIWAEAISDLDRGESTYFSKSELDHQNFETEKRRDAPYWEGPVEDYLIDHPQSTMVPFKDFWDYLAQVEGMPWSLDRRERHKAKIDAAFEAFGWGKGDGVARRRNAWHKTGRAKRKPGQQPDNA